MLIEQMMVTHMAVFCYLVACEKSGKGVLIDPAGDFNIIDSVIESNGIEIQWLVNTHSHYDHTSGNMRMFQKTGAPLLIHEKEAGNVKMDPRHTIVRYSGNRDSGSIQALRDRDVIRFGEEELLVVHTPGHSPGCISLFGKGNIFTGDTLFTEGMGRTDLGGGSYAEIMHSIKKKILSYPDETVIWPGHHYGRKASSTVAEQKRYYGQ